MMVLVMVGEVVLEVVDNLIKLIINKINSLKNRITSGDSIRNKNSRITSNEVSANTSNNSKITKNNFSKLF